MRMIDVVIAFMFGLWMGVNLGIFIVAMLVGPEEEDE